MDFYFSRTGPDSYRATKHVAGAWNPAEQHISPAIGLLAHLMEADHAARQQAKDRSPMQLGRISADIYGVIPVDEFSYSLEVLRPGRSIELVQATLTYRERTIVLMRAWFMQSADTSAIAAAPLTHIPGPADTPEWDMRTVWPGGYIESVETRREQVEPGHARTWMRTAVDLTDDVRAGKLARAIALFDTANGTTVRHDPRQVAFPNVDLTASWFRMPHGDSPEPAGRTTDWLGVNTRVSFGPTGLGLTTSTLHDEQGPFGILNQTLTVRPTE